MPDLLEHGPDRPPWTLPRWLVSVSVVLAVAAGTTGAIAATDRGARPVPPSVATPPSYAHSSGAVAMVPPWRTPPKHIAGQLIGAKAPTRGPRPTRVGTVDERDLTAATGAWTVTVRRDDGSLGRHGAVVTYPAPKAGLTSVRVGDVMGHTYANVVTWQLAGKQARIRGDLPLAELVAIAAATSVPDGRPMVDPPTGFEVDASGLYYAPHTREARYWARSLGAGSALGGLVFSGVRTGGGLEDEMYRDGHVRASGMVQGHPAVTWDGAGSGILAWEPVPGVVAYVGYSGAPMLGRGHTVAALHRLARRSRLVGPVQWRATHPQVTEESHGS